MKILFANAVSAAGSAIVGAELAPPASRVHHGQAEELFERVEVPVGVQERMTVEETPRPARPHRSRFFRISAWRAVASSDGRPGAQNDRLASFRFGRSTTSRPHVSSFDSRTRSASR